MNYKRTYPLTIEYLLLGKASTLVEGIKRDPVLKDKLDSSSGRFVCLKFDEEEVKDYYKNQLINSPNIKRGIKNKLIKIY